MSVYRELVCDGVGTFKLAVKHELGLTRAEKKIIWYPALWICVLLVISVPSQQALSGIFLKASFPHHGFSF